MKPSSQRCPGAPCWTAERDREGGFSGPGQVDWDEVLAVSYLAPEHRVFTAMGEV